MGVAALASLAAGAIHSTAVAAHGEHRQAAIAMAVTAVFQLTWGAVALMQSHRWLSWSGLIGHSAAVGGWLLAKTTGIPFIAGLQAAEGPQFADTLAAVLATAAAFGALGVVVDPTWARRLTRPLRTSTTAGLAALVLVAMVSVSGDSHDHGAVHGGMGTHDHTGVEEADHDHGGDPHERTAGHGDDGHGHEGDGDGHAEGEHAAGADASHDHDDPDAPHGDHDDADAPHDGHDDPHAPPPGEDPGHDHGDEPVPTKPYDATLPVDLGGVPGVTPEQQARAEAVVTDTIINLPQFADRATAESLGYRSIGDAFTGYEHLVNWELIGDGKILDANSPESLVYRVESDGRHTLVSAMYFLEWGETLDDLPDVGGALMQWHGHDDLCFTGEDNAWRVGPVATPPAGCPEPYIRLDLPPMIHVWIVPHPCGPFAALEGVAGGQVPDGETRLCDHAHGSTA